MSSRDPVDPAAEWTVASFSHERGLGTVRNRDGVELTFDFTAWRLGDWKPSRKDYAAAGTAPPGLPRVGEPVRVERDDDRATVVQPTGRVSRPEYKLGSWLKAIAKQTGHFASLKPAKLLEAIARLDQDLAEEWRDDEPRDATDFANLLAAIAQLADQDPAWGAAHGDWVYIDDHRWDRARAARRLPALLGLPPGGVPAAGDGMTTGVDQSLVDYADACNERAKALGIELRLYEVDLDADEFLFVCAAPKALRQLVKRGYLGVEER